MTSKGSRLLAGAKMCWWQEVFVHPVIVQWQWVVVSAVFPVEFHSLLFLVLLLLLTPGILLMKCSIHRNQPTYIHLFHMEHVPFMLLGRAAPILFSGGTSTNHVHVYQATFSLAGIPMQQRWEEIITSCQHL